MSSLFRWAAARWSSVAVVLMLSGCLNADEVVLRITPTEQVRLSPAPIEISVQIYELDLNGTRPLVFSAEITANVEMNNTETALSDLAGDVASLGALEVDARYEVELDATYTEGICRRQSAVGQAQFVHRVGGYVIPVQIGCVNEFGTVAGASTPVVPRLGAGLAVDDNGTAVLAGGAPIVRVLPTQGITEVLDSIERYDYRIAEFREAGELIRRRVFPSLVPLENGGVGVFGGIAPTGPRCESQIEAIVGDASTPSRSLAQGRCEPAVTVLAPQNVLVVAGGTDLAVDPNPVNFEFYDPNARVVPPGNNQRPPRGEVYRRAPEIVPINIGQGAIVVGGIDPEMEPAPDTEPPTAEYLIFDAALCDPEDSPCTIGITGPASLRGLSRTAAASVSCPGEPPDPTYIVGGLTFNGTEFVASDEVYCIEGEVTTDRRLEFVGRLPEPRAYHEMVTLPSVDGFARLLVVGGTQSSRLTDAHRNALLLSVNPCECVEIPTTGTPSQAILPNEEVSLPWDGLPVLHSVAVLPDLSVLATGGAQIVMDGDGVFLEATGEAAVFFPER